MKPPKYLTTEEKVRLWDAINAYVITCGGDPGATTAHSNYARMNAVIAVEQAVEHMVNGIQEEETGPDLWGCMVTRWCDQGRTAHLLRRDGSPACGARYYASCGAGMPRGGVSAPLCRRCEGIEKRRQTSTPPREQKAKERSA